MIRNEPKLSQIVRRVKIENRAHVQQTARGVAVVTRFEPERAYDRLQTANVIRQLRGPHRRVFDERDRFCRTDAAGHERKSGFAHHPNEIHFMRVAADRCAQSEISLLQDRQPLLHVVVVKFDEQNRFAWFRVELHQIARRLEMELAFRLIEQGTIDVLDRGRLEIEQGNGRLHCVHHRSEENQAEAFLAR